MGACLSEQDGDRERELVERAEGALEVQRRDLAQVHGHGRRAAADADAENDTRQQHEHLRGRLVVRRKVAGHDGQDAAEDEEHIHRNEE